MTPEVKQRIEQIRQGIVPEGYKKTVFGYIPIQWKFVKCRDVLKNVTLGSNYQPCERGSFPLIKMGNIGRGSMVCGKTEYLKDKSEANEKDLLKYGDILFNTRNTMELVGKVAIWHNELPVAYFNSNIMRLSFFPELISTNEYANYLFNLGTVLSQLRRLATGTTSVAAIYRRDLDIVRLALPSLDQQKKIAEILATQDRAIELQEKLLAEKRRQKKYLMQQLLTGKKRLRDFHGDWKREKLGKLFAERNETQCDHLELLAITGAQGVIPRSMLDLKDNSSEDKSKYLHICVGDIGYNTMRMWQGVSAYSKYEGIVSPAYTILRPKGKVNAKFFSYLFKLPEVIFIFYRFSQGLVDDTRNLKYEDFKTICVTYPEDTQEQNAITSILEKADQEIELLCQAIEQEKKKKKALMQLLLTGIVRV